MGIQLLHKHIVATLGYPISGTLVSVGDGGGGGGGRCRRGREHVWVATINPALSSQCWFNFPSSFRGVTESRTREEGLRVLDNSIQNEKGKGRAGGGEGKKETLPRIMIT